MLALPQMPAVPPTSAAGHSVEYVGHDGRRIADDVFSGASLHSLPFLVCPPIHAIHTNIPLSHVATSPFVAAPPPPSPFEASASGSGHFAGAAHLHHHILPPLQLEYHPKQHHAHHEHHANDDHQQNQQNQHPNSSQRTAGRGRTAANAAQPVARDAARGEGGSCGEEGGVSAPGDVYERIVAAALPAALDRVEVPREDGLSACMRVPMTVR
ncbi:hypothetical protein C8J57DRAFT_1728605 [Mycena rebaudengoi]|nr:hypothetical protein C8J57DRAFT_1728605 [Mycena rebaudengoi]